MTADKKIFTNQIRDGQSVDDLFMVKEMSRAETRAGKPYLILTLMDRNGELPGRLWENAEALMPLCEPGKLLQITGQAQAYRGNLQLKIDAVHNIDKTGADLSLFLQTSKKNIDDMAREIRSLAESVQDPYYRKLLLAFLDDRAFTEKFTRAPAAKSMHHAYLGGLLEHTLAVAQLSETLISFYPALDRDLLMAGALLHDIGKTAELGFGAYPFDYTDKGRLMGHLVLGSVMIQEKASTISGFPDDLLTRLLHLVLSHHGRYEFGSPSLPMIREAFILNFLDDLDAKMNFLDRLEEMAAEPGYQWSDFQRTLERFLFINGQPFTESAPPGTPSLQPPDDRTD
ncbi:3'-5' exoribonuclease YhaM family protein, partial [Thermodesulfobacteriota bacterium]